MCPWLVASSPLPCRPLSSPPAVTPTSVAFNPVSVALEFFFGTTKGHIVKMDGNGAVLNVLVTPGSSAIHHLSSHPTMALLFSAHADGHVRTYDVSSGACSRGVRACAAVRVDVCEGVSVCVRVCCVCVRVCFVCRAFLK